MAIVQPVLTNAQKLEIINYVNAYRKAHQAPPLAWDDTIATFSQYWSYYLISNNLFQHSQTKLYGENLAWFQGYGTDVMTLIKKSIDNWYNEVSLYDFTKSEFSSGTGHFTCLVWKSSTKFAMGISYDASSNTVDVTMNTSPPGNIIGKFKENVLPLVGPTPAPAPAPVPVPVPAPVPTPVPTPLPESTKTNIVNKLYGVLYSININATKYTIYNNIYSIVTDINNLIYSLSNSGYGTNAHLISELYILINDLYGIITAIQKKQPKLVTIASLNSIITKVTGMQL